jgi:hypothetical protein
MPRPLRPGVGLLVVGLGTIAAPLDTAVNIAFPSITRAFALEVATSARSSRRAVSRFVVVMLDG